MLRLNQRGKLHRRFWNDVLDGTIHQSHEKNRKTTDEDMKEADPCPNRLLSGSSECSCLDFRPEAGKLSFAFAVVPHGVLVNRLSPSPL